MSSIVRFALVLGFALPLLPLSSARAEEAEPEYERNGGYLMVSGGMTHEEFSNNDNPDTDIGWAVGAAWGYRSHPNLGAELQFRWLSRLTKEKDFSTTDRQEIQTAVDIWSLTGGIKVYYPMKRFQPYLKTNIGFLTAAFQGIGTDTEVGFVFQPGIGTDFYITEKFALNLNYDYMIPISKAVRDLQYGLLSGGVKYRF